MRTERPEASAERSVCAMGMCERADLDESQLEAKLKIEMKLDDKFVKKFAIKTKEKKKPARWRVNDQRP